MSEHEHCHDVSTTGSKDSNNPNILGYLNDGSTKQPFFEKHTIATQQDDGYWIEPVDVTGNGTLDLVTSGLAVGNVVWYENPSWEKRTIAQFPLPVAVIPGDINGNGHNDLFVSHNYGNCMFWCRPGDGKITWLENPGEFSSGAEWKKHFIADLMATHRLQFGNFSRTDKKELLALPVVGCRPYGVGVHEPVALTLFPVPDDVGDGGDWKGTVINDDTFRIIHGVVNHPFRGASSSDLNSFLLASEEGINWFYFNSESGQWNWTPIGSGDDTSADKGFKGCGNVAFGRLGDDPYGYICTIDPFHGNIVTVYTRKPDDRLPGDDLTARPWNRFVLDTFGEFTEESQGAGHHVMTGDFDGDGDDEFLVALRGPLPTQGVYYYKAIDAPNGFFERWRVSTASAARIAVGDFDGDGRLDFATTGYYTPGYFLCDNSQVNVFYNRFGDVPGQKK